MTMPEDEQARRAHLAKHTEFARSAFFSVSVDILDTMRAGRVEEAEAIVMTGALEMAVQTWLQVALRSGVPPQRARKTLETEMRRFWQKHLKIENEPVEPEPAKSAIEV